MKRRTFLKLSALAGTAVIFNRMFGKVAFGSETLFSEESATTTGEKWVPTSCLNCSSACATQVRVIDGKAVKITGNPLDKVSEGKNCARAHVGLQVLYDSERLTGPMKRTNPLKGHEIDPKWVVISWDEAIKTVSERLNRLRIENQPHQLAIFYGLNSISDIDVINRFGETYGTPNIISTNSLENEADKVGEWLADGNYSQSGYDLPQTNYILSFGANILESSKPLSRNLRMWGKFRHERPNRAKVVVVDPRYSVTAAKSDHWISINPGTDAALAMSIASVIIREELYDSNFIKNWTTGFEEYKQLVLNYYHPREIADVTGINAETISQLAREFARTKPAIAWRGRGATAWPNGAYTSYAIFCLNALVGSIDVPGGVIYQQNPDYRALPGVVEDGISKEGVKKPRIDLARTNRFPAAEVVTNHVADSILSGTPYPVEIAIGFNTNLNMSAPGNQRWDEALSKVPYYIHVSPFASEMACYADMLLPSSTFLETWGYDHSPPGSGFAELKIKQPVVELLHDTKNVIDIVIALAKGLGGTINQSFSDIGDNAEDFVRFRTQNLVSWDVLKKNGVWVGPSYEYYKYGRIFNTPSKKFEFLSGNLGDLLKKFDKETSDKLIYLPHYEETRFMGEKNDYPLLLSTYHPALNIENGSQNYPWAQECYLLEHGTGWTNLAEINASTAIALSIRDGDMVWIESPFGKIKARAGVFEGIHPQVVSIASGQGYYAYGSWAKGIGVNPNTIIGVDYDNLSGQSSFFNTRVKVYRA